MGSGGKRVTGRRDPAGGDVGGDDVADEVAALRGLATTLGAVGVSLVSLVIGAAPASVGEESRLTRGRATLPGGVGWRARIRTWNPLIQSQVLYR